MINKIAGNNKNYRYWFEGSMLTQELLHFFSAFFQDSLLILLPYYFRHCLIFKTAFDMTDTVHSVFHSKYGSIVLNMWITV